MPPENKEVRYLDYEDEDEIIESIPTPEQVDGMNLLPSQRRALRAASERVHSVIIAPEHQSAPKEHWADKEVRKAAEEIESGQFRATLDADDELFSIGLQRGQLPNSPLDIDMEATRQSLLLAKHPRVIEALARLEQEKRDAKTSEEAIEKSQMLFEMNESASAQNQWDGQDRWQGKDNEAMRKGEVLTCLEFVRRLQKVIGETRVIINSFAVDKRVALLVPNIEKRVIAMPGETLPENQPDFRQVATLQYPCSTEWMVMRFDEYGVPTTAKYLGWRTALLAMIRDGVISEKEAHKAFPLGSGPAASWYREQLYMIRCERGTVQ